MKTCTKKNGGSQFDQDLIPDTVMELQTNAVKTVKTWNIGVVQFFMYV